MNTLSLHSNPSRTLIVVPCYNEARRLNVARFREFASAQPELAFLFVNDGSRDGTAEILAGLAAEQPRQFRWLDLPQNQGKAEAVRQGMLQAFQFAPEYIGFWDADLATPLEAIPQFCEILDRRPEIGLVIGTRLPLIGHQILRRPIRRFLGRVFSTVAASLLGLPVYDSQCGAKLFRAVPAIQAAFEERFLARWIFDVEILSRLAQRETGGARRLAGRVFEFPLDVWREVAGSKLKSMDFVTAAWELSQIRRRTLSASPLPPATDADWVRPSQTPDRQAA
jgi:glycosyltransferase involved in cell wall biosynthesis